MSVGNTSDLEQPWQCVVVELGIAPGPRPCPHIDHAGGAMCCQQTDEFPNGPSRVSDGEHRRRSFGLFVFRHGKEFCGDSRILRSGASKAQAKTMPKRGVQRS